MEGHCRDADDCVSFQTEIEPQRPHLEVLHYGGVIQLNQGLQYTANLKKEIREISKQE